MVKGARRDTGGRFGFVEPFQAAPMSDVARKQSTAHLQQQRVSQGMERGQRDPPASAEERAQLESAIQESRGRLGWLEGARSSLNDAERAKLDNYNDRARLGWIHERDPNTSPAIRADVAHTKAVERARLGWAEERSSCTPQQRAEASSLVKRRAAGLGFTEERDTTSAADRKFHRSGIGSERERYGWRPDLEATDRKQMRQDATIGRTTRETAIMNGLRLYANEPRTESSAQQRSMIKNMMDAARGNLGWLEQRTITTEPHQSRENAAFLGRESRSRLGFLEERTSYPAEERSRREAMSKDAYARLGFHEDRDVPTVQLRNDQARRLSVTAARLGMAADAPRDFSLAERQRAQDARLEERHRLGHQTVRNPKWATEGAHASLTMSNGHVLTPRRPFHSNTWHFGSVGWDGANTSLARNPSVVKSVRL